MQQVNISARIYICDHILTINNHQSDSRPVSKTPSPVPGHAHSYGSARYLPKQYSCTSNSSAYLSPQVDRV